MKKYLRAKIIHKIQRFNVFDTCKCVPKSFFDFHNATPIKQIETIADELHLIRNTKSHIGGKNENKTRT